jgi:hypothetical protein
MRTLRRFHPGLLALLPLTTFSLWLPAGAPAQLASVGLSEVGGQRFAEEDLLLFVPAAGDRFGAAVAAGDFDGDGADDLATGIPFDDGPVGSGCDDCGIVVVRYGVDGRGLEGGLADTVLYQGFGGSSSPPNPGEQFGAALAAGDFNGDGFDDLAVGAPRDHQLNPPDPTGAAFVYYGGPNGIEPPQGAELLHEWLPWSNGDSRYCYDAQFGAVLAVGDFDADGFDDLALGAPNACVELVGTEPPVRGGEAYVAHGSADGLVPLSGYLMSQRSPGLHGDLETGDFFGAAVAAGDFNADGFDDLAIGVPREDDSGALNILFGSEFGLLFATDVYWLQFAAGLEPEAGDRFGFALIAADFDGDGHDDLAIGDPSEDLGAANEIPDAGHVTVFYGSPALFDYGLTRNFAQGTIYGAGQDEAADRFGWTLAAGDFDGDGRADLAVGHPTEDTVHPDEGAVTILMGGAGAGFGERFRFLEAGWEGLPGSLAGNADNGRALAVGDFDGSGFADLAIGAPLFDVSGVGTDVGDVKVLYGSLFADGLERGSAQRWSGVTP